MKKLFGLLALVLAVVSCQNDFDGANVGGDEVAVTLNVAVPDDATRAAGSDSGIGAIGNIDLQNDYDIRYILEVYDALGNLAKSRIVNREGDSKSTSFDLRLVPGRKYTFVVWADFIPQDQEDEKVDYHYNTSNIKAISLNGEQKANDESRDAYTCAYVVEEFQSGAINIVLTRPFAKLRVVTTDMNHLYSDLTSVKVTYTTPLYTTFNALTGEKGGLQSVAAKEVDFTEEEDTEEGTEVDYVYVYTESEYKDQGKMTLFADYFFGAQDDAIHFTLDVKDETTMTIPTVVFNTNIPVQRNYLTTVMGPVLTDAANVTVEIKDAFDGYINHEDEEVSITVDSAEDFIEAIESEDIDTIVLTGDINLNDLVTRAADPTLTVKHGKELTIDLGGKTLSATSTQTGKNYNMFNVYGTLTVKNGTMECEHKGENMGWNNSTNIFHVEGGVLNLEGVTAKNLGGSDMGFVAHLNNWGEVTLNVENCTLESNYVPVRVFNSGPNMNNVDIKNSTLTGNSAAFWVHNYTVADFGTEAKAEAQKALLNLNIYNQGNTFSPDVNGIRYGFTNSIRTDAYGITKVVSEDGTVVTLGSFVENGVIRRGVAGAEENTTITKVVVEEGVGVLYDRTFYRYFALETVELPSTLTVLGANDNDYYSCGNVFQGCEALKNIVIPESVTIIGPGAFYGCKSLESINIPAGVTRIEENALRETGLTSVEFHAGVTYFGAQAFRDCKQLKEVIINAPEFTVEANAFGVMAGALPGTTIYVVNAEMKAYLESTLAYANQFSIVAPEVVNNTEDLKAALDTDAKMVSVAAGAYTFPSSSVKAGQTIICAEGTVFTGTSSLNIKGATVVGATFSNPEGQAVSGTIYGTFQDCTFEGSEALRWCYTTVGETTVFENCVIKTDWRGFHFDDHKGILIFKNCEINGFNAYGGNGKVTFEGCIFGCDQSRYNGLNIYSDTDLVNCTFNYVSGKTNFVDLEAAGKTLTITNCTATLDGNPANIADYVGGSKKDECTVIIK